MSDYLWDKKGEPDAEVARLEAMLGAFAHEPRPLNLPAEAVPPGPPPTARLLPFAARPRPSRLFAPAALAAAAALLVAAVLVASAFLRARVSSGDERAVVPESSQPKRDAREDERPAPREAERVMIEPPPPAGLVNGGRKVESDAVVNLPNVARRKGAGRPSGVVRRRQKGPDAGPAPDVAGGGLTLEAMSARGGELVEDTRLLTKEQLVYALRLTGAKLKDVRQRAQGTKAEDRP